MQNIHDPLPRKIEYVMKYARKPEDMLQRCTPFAVPPSSPFLQTLIKKVKAYLDGPPSGDYDAVMNLLEDSITTWGLEGAYNDAEVFSIVPYYKWDAPVLRSAVAWPVSSLFMCSAICRQVCWQTLTILWLIRILRHVLVNANHFVMRLCVDVHAFPPVAQPLQMVRQF